MSYIYEVGDRVGVNTHTGPEYGTVVAVEPVGRTYLVNFDGNPIIQHFPFISQLSPANLNGYYRNRRAAYDLEDIG